MKFISFRKLHIFSFCLVLLHGCGLIKKNDKASPPPILSGEDNPPDEKDEEMSDAERRLKGMASDATFDMKPSFEKARKLVGEMEDDEAKEFALAYENVENSKEAVDALNELAVIMMEDQGKILPALFSQNFHESIFNLILFINHLFNWIYLPTFLTESQDLQDTEIFEIIKISAKVSETKDEATLHFLSFAPAFFEYDTPTPLRHERYLNAIRHYIAQGDVLKSIKDKEERLAIVDEIYFTVSGILYPGDEVDATNE